MSEELFIIIKWYLLFFIFGIIGLGLIYKYTKNWPDKGYGISKFVGLLLFGAIAWFLNSYRLVSLQSSLIYLIILLALLILAVRELKKSGLKINRLIIAEEIVFLIVFVIWCAIRSTNSTIEGTEKFMNLAFMNSINRTDFVPAIDPWITNGTINYYYFGHFLFAFAGKVLAIPMSYAYNLAMVTIIAFAFIGIMSVLLKLTNYEKNKKLSFAIALCTALWICFGSNMHYGYKWLEAVATGKEFTYWFPDGTRIIPNVIDEFPAYSIALADLHGHYLGMPYLIVVIAALLIAKNFRINSVAKIKFNLMLSILVVALYGINTWDFLTANVMFLILHIFQAFHLKAKFTERIKFIFIAELAILIPGLAVFAVYLLNFHPSVGGLGIVPFNVKSEAGPWLLMWGQFLLITAFSIITIIIIKRIAKEPIWGAVKNMFKKNNNALFALFLNFMALALIIGVEIFYIRDIFEKSNPPFFRTNTVFKFYFQAWVIWGIACGYHFYHVIGKIFTTPVRINFAILSMYSIPILIFYISSVSYIVEAVNDYYSFLKYPEGKNFSFELMLEGKSGNLIFYKTLDGNNYIKEMYPEDYAAIKWINSNISGQPVILEAVGDAYTYFSRISTNTGLQTPMGWPTHQWQWRNNSDVVFVVKEEINSIYITPDANRLAAIIKKYNAEYIFVGIKEREIAPELDEKIFEQNGKVVFSQGNTRIYKVNRQN